jgi:hypothetical protein
MPLSGGKAGERKMKGIFGKWLITPQCSLHAHFYLLQVGRKHLLFLPLRAIVIFHYILLII